MISSGLPSSSQTGGRGAGEQHREHRQQGDHDQPVGSRFVVGERARAFDRLAEMPEHLDQPQRRLEDRQRHHCPQYTHQPGGGRGRGWPRSVGSSSRYASTSSEKTAKRMLAPAAWPVIDAREHRQREHAQGQRQGPRHPQRPAVAHHIERHRQHRQRHEHVEDREVLVEGVVEIRGERQEARTSAPRTGSSSAARGPPPAAAWRIRIITSASPSGSSTPTVPSLWTPARASSAVSAAAAAAAASTVRESQAPAAASPRDHRRRASGSQPLRSEPSVG